MNFIAKKKKVIHNNYLPNSNEIDEELENRSRKEHSSCCPKLFDDFSIM